MRASFKIFTMYFIRHEYFLWTNSKSGHLRSGPCILGRFSARNIRENLKFGTVTTHGVTAINMKFLFLQACILIIIHNIMYLYHKFYINTNQNLV